MAVPINTKSRSELKAFFTTGSRPTAAQFGLLIDAMVNAKDDSLVKSNASPLRLQAEQTGQTNAIPKVVEFYNDFLDANPVADLSLKSPSNPSGASGLSINVGGQQLLFFDATTLNIGLGTSAVPTDKTKTIFIDPNWQMWFGSKTRQMINLWGNEYAIGVQAGTQYFRSFSHFGWHRGGVHSDNQLDPGAGGTRLMYLNSSGELAVSGAIHAQNSDMYFTKTNHNHTGFGNAVGFAAIENGADYGALMILGRMLPTGRRFIQLWDDVDVAGRLRPSAGGGENGIVFPENPFGGGGDRASIQYIQRGGESTALLIKVKDNIDDIISLESTGGVFCNGALVLTSDKRLKENIEPLKYGLSQIKKLLPVSYDWKNRVNHKKTIGLLAQDVGEVIKEALYENKKDANNTEFCLSYNSLIPVLINAIKELDQKLEETQLKLAKLQVT